MKNYLISSLLAILSCINPAFAYNPCEFNTANDKGLRTLIESVNASNAQLLISQKNASMIQTPVKGEPEHVDVLKWCHCVYERKFNAFGADFAEVMTSFKLMAKYNDWLKKQSPQKVAEHYLVVQSFEANCYNEAQTNQKPERVSGGDFLQLMNSQFNSQTGLGNIVMNLKYEKLISLLGPPRKSNKNAVGENLYFGPLGGELLVVVMPPGALGVVKAIQVNESFKGGN